MKNRSEVGRFLRYASVGLGISLALSQLQSEPVRQDPQEAGRKLDQQLEQQLKERVEKARRSTPGCVIDNVDTEIRAILRQPSKTGLPEFSKSSDLVEVPGLEDVQEAELQRAAFEAQFLPSKREKDHALLDAYGEIEITKKRIAREEKESQFVFDENLLPKTDAEKAAECIEAKTTSLLVRLGQDSKNVTSSQTIRPSNERNPMFQDGANTEDGSR